MEREAQGINQIDGVIADIGVAVEGLRVGDGTGDGVRSHEPANGRGVVPEDGVVVARFRVALLPAEWTLRQVTLLRVSIAGLL